MMGAELFIAKLLKFVFALSILIIIHEWGHFIAAVKAGVRVEVFSIGFGRKLFSRKKNDTEFCVSAIPLGGYVKLAGDNREEARQKPDEFLSQPARKRLAIVASGPAMNYVFGFLFLWIVFMVGYPAFGTKVGGLIDGMGAQAAGIAVNDRIVAVEGVGVSTWDELVAALRRTAQKERVGVLVSRGNKNISFVVDLAMIDKVSLLGEKSRGRGLGITPSLEDNRVVARYAPHRAFAAGIVKTVDMTTMTYKALWYIATGKVSARRSVGGPVAMFDWFGAVRTPNEFLLLLAAVSVGLAIFNLLPFPALDGGHILLLGIEKIRGKQLSRRSEEIFARFGYSVLIALAVLITFNDLVNRGTFGRAVEKYQTIIRKFNGHAR